MSNLLLAQFKFTEDVADLVIWIKNRGWKCKLTELGVQPVRTGFSGLTKLPGIVDAVHKQKGNHYRCLATDVQLFIPNETPTTDDDYVKSSDHPAWIELSSVWEALDPDNRTGIGFRDANHVARMWNGVI